jgi:hypothetical protein
MEFYAVIGIKGIFTLVFIVDDLVIDDIVVFYYLLYKGFLAVIFVSFETYKGFIIFFGFKTGYLFDLPLNNYSSDRICYGRSLYFFQLGIFGFEFTPQWNCHLLKLIFIHNGNICIEYSIVIIIYISIAGIIILIITLKLLYLRILESKSIGSFMHILDKPLMK